MRDGGPNGGGSCAAISADLRGRRSIVIARKIHINHIDKLNPGQCHQPVVQVPGVSIVAGVGSSGNLPAGALAKDKLGARGNGRHGRFRERGIGRQT